VQRGRTHPGLRPHPALELGRLPRADLDEERALLGEVLARAGGEAIVDLEPGRARDERGARLVVADLGRQLRHLGLGHVRRVADDQVEAPLDRAEQIAPMNGHLHLEPRRVARGDLEGLGRQIRELDRDARPLGRERDPDRAGPRAQIEDAGLAARLEQIERALDERLGVRARHEHARRHLEAPAPELAAPEDVGHRLTPAAALHELADRGALRLVERTIEVHVQAHAVEPDRLRDEQLGVQPRRLDPAGGEVLGRPLDDLPDAPRAHRAMDSTQGPALPCPACLGAFMACSV